MHRFPASFASPVTTPLRWCLALFTLILILVPGGTGLAQDEEVVARTPVVGAPWVEVVPGTAIELTMRPVPGPEGEPLWVMETELSWNLFDIFIFRLDEKKGASSPASDAVTRPTKPYIAVDRGFGHDGYPAISMSLKGAIQFAEWLSAKTGRTYRVPTVDQWTRICTAASIPSDELEAYAWYQANSNETTHPLGSRKADALGLHDLYGNVGEWCIAGGTEEKPVGVLMGGGYESPATELDCTHTVPYDPMWNDSDPQFPKSIWWLADAAYVGLRLVCVEDAAADEISPAVPVKTQAPSKEDTHE
ncbi:MAG: SUMF1/EgtB/PvdO family nonheme iron enzyme [Planctomycetota bacterium]|nr:SUMF1/EgtB/PvdO family nonheme iron enzyme [Planctomycetota bacterium]